MTHLIWLRNDLRIEDNPALFHGSQQQGAYCVYIISHQQWREHSEAHAKIALWRKRLIYLSAELKTYNIPLKLLCVESWQDVPKALLEVAQQYHSSTVFFNKEYPLNEKARDSAVCDTLAQHNIKTESFDGDVVIPPGQVLTQQGAIYKVFTPFSRQWHKQLSSHHLQIVGTPQKQAKSLFTSDDIDQDWPSEYSYREDLWPADTDSIHQRLQRFCAQKAALYKEQRDIPSINGTSTLSPYLTIGAISAKQCLLAIAQAIPHWQENQWATEIIWREFYRHLIDHYPHLSRSDNFIQTTHDIPWENNPEAFDAWCQGQTGFPIVDAAMRQLQQTGWMHNRLRMVSAAFLTKLLLVDWRWGERFFMEQLIDGDYASNNGGWQWAASTGADAAPYFRIFNPQRQSERFDKEGEFIKKLVPELTSLDARSIHQPSSAQHDSCDYPKPIIDYSYARSRALDGYAHAMGKTKSK